MYIYSKTNCSISKKRADHFPESTTYPGTTTEVVQPIIESEGISKVGESLSLVYLPEREDPGNESYSSVDIPKGAGGVTKDCLER